MCITICQERWVSTFNQPTKGDVNINISGLRPCNTPGPQNGTSGNGGGSTTWRVLTIQLPAYLCPPTCETLTINARFASELCFSCAEIFSCFSSGVTLRSSRGGPIVSEGCSSCVSASQPCDSKDLMNAIEPIWIGMSWLDDVIG